MKLIYYTPGDLYGNGVRRMLPTDKMSELAKLISRERAHEEALRS